MAILLVLLVWRRGRPRSFRAPVPAETLEQGYVLFECENNVSQLSPLRKDLKEEEQGIGMASVKGSTGVDRKHVVEFHAQQK